MLYFFKLGFRNDVILLVALFLFILIIDKVLILLAQDPELSIKCSELLLKMYIGVSMHYIFDSVRSFLNAQHIFYKPSFIMLVSIILHYIILSSINLNGSITLGKIALVTGITYSVAVILIIYFTFKSSLNKSIGDLFDFKWIFS